MIYKKILTGLLVLSCYVLFEISVISAFKYRFYKNLPFPYETKDKALDDINNSKNFKKLIFR